MRRRDKKWETNDPEYYEFLRMKRSQKKQEINKNKEENKICLRCNDNIYNNHAKYCLLHWISSLGYNVELSKKLLDLLEDQKYRCKISGELLIPGKNASIDHIVPKSKNGLNDINNLQWVTIDINCAKREMSNEEFINLCKRIIYFNQQYI